MLAGVLVPLSAVPVKATKAAMDFVGKYEFKKPLLAEKMRLKVSSGFTGPLDWQNHT